jgi:hypothetical protein
LLQHETLVHNCWHEELSNFFFKYCSVVVIMVELFIGSGW